MQRQVDIVLQGLHQVGRDEGRQQTGHVLERDGIAAHGRQFTPHLDEAGHVMDRAHRVTDGALSVLTGGLGRLDRGLEIARIVQRVEDAEDIHAVRGGARHEGTDHVIGIMPVAEQVLASQQHLQAGLGQGLAQLAQTLPGIFLQEAHAGVERRAAPAFQRPVADSVELGTDRQHVLRAHAGREQ